jgi:hypothetical protein
MACALRLESTYYHKMMRSFQTTAFLGFIMVSQAADAGYYGSERWGEMYWGANAASAPVGSPTITSATATDDQITIVLDDFPVGTGADGWSAVTSYTVTCGASSVTTSDSEVTITGLDSDTGYSCSVTANNREGTGPELVRVVTTDPALTGLNITLMCAAIDCNQG